MYPILLDLTRKRVLVVGGGKVAERKVCGLLEAGAPQIRLVSPSATRRIQELAATTLIRWEQRAYFPDDLAEVDLAFAATDDPTLNAQIAEQGRRSGVWVNVATNPQQGDFHLPAVLRRGELLVAIGTGGSGPALAAAVRDRIAQTFGPELGEAVVIYAAFRRKVLARLSNPTRRTALLRQAAEIALSGIPSEQLPQVLDGLLAASLSEEETPP